MTAANVIDLEAWKGELASSKQGFKKTMGNLMVFLRNVRELGPNIRWNEMAQRAEWVRDGVCRPLEDGDLVDIRVLLEDKGFEPDKADVYPAVMRHARMNKYHPIREYLAGLEWDKVERLDTWLQDCMGAPDTSWVRAVGRKTLIAAIARAKQPGCKVDTVLVIEGPQGIRKSSGVAALFGEDYTAESVNLFDQHNKMVMAMMGAWVVELAEFVAIARRDENQVKGMLSMRSDRVVLPYAKMASDHPRQCIFFGTINPGETGYLTDSTGNRRYWPVEVTKIDIPLINKLRNQLWAEAHDAFNWHERWWLDGDEEEALAKAETEAREIYDVWEEILSDKLALRASVSLAQALHELGFDNDKMKRADELRAAKVLKRIGFEQKVTKEGVPRKSVRRWVRTT